MKNNNNRASSKECPICGEEISAKARSCPHCGADDRTGWDERETRYDGLDLPETVFEVEALPGESAKKTFVFSAIGWWLVAVLITALMIYLLFRGAF